jgi:hypothetical protein
LETYARFFDARVLKWFKDSRSRPPEAASGK